MRHPLLYYVILIPMAALSGLLFLAIIRPFGSTNADYWQLCQVATDAETPGRAAVLLLEGRCSFPNRRVIYETRDYGASWQKLTEPEANTWTFVEDRISELRFSGGGLFLGNRQVWTYPRAMFRVFFWSWDNYSGSNVANIFFSTQAFGSAYAALGRDGLLIGPYLPDSAVHSWTLVIEPFEELRPRPLTIHSPLHLLLITALGLLVPPLPFIHAWLLAQVWRYAVPGHEMAEALRPAWRISLQLTVIAVVAVMLWLTNINTRFYAIVGGMAVLVVVVGLINAYQIAQQANRGLGFTVRLLVGTALVSLIVPAGVATSHLGFGWPVILSLLTGFIIYRRTLDQEMRVNASQWEVDRLALEVVGMALIVLAILSGAIPIQVGAVIVLTTYSAGRLTWVLLQSSDGSKKVSVLGALSYQGIFLNGQWWTLWFFMSIGWVFSAAGISSVVFFAQLAAQGYFKWVGWGFL